VGKLFLAHGYFRTLFIVLAFRKCEKDINILNIILVQDFCPHKTGIAPFPSGFNLKTFKGVNAIVPCEAENVFFDQFDLLAVMEDQIFLGFIQVERGNTLLVLKEV